MLKRTLTIATMLGLTVLGTGCSSEETSAAQYVFGLFFVLGFLYYGGFTLKLITTGGVERRLARDKQDAEMHDDLRKALQSADYRRLDDFLVMWGNKVDKKALEYIRARRDGLYVEGNR